MMDELDVVALVREHPELNLTAGQVGTIVDVLGPGMFYVEFVDDEGGTYALAAFAAEDLLKLIHNGQGKGKAAAFAA